MIAGFGPGCIIQTTIFCGKIRLCLHQQINRCNRNKMGRLKQLLPRNLYINDPGGLPLLDLAWSFELNVPDDRRGSQHHGLDAHVQSRVWSTLSAQVASNLVSPKGI